MKTIFLILLKGTRRVIWRCGVVLYAGFLYPADALEDFIAPDLGNTKEKTTINVKKYWYRYGKNLQKKKEKNDVKSQNKKPSIMLLNVEQYLHSIMPEYELKTMALKYELLFAESITDALYKLTKASLIGNPIRGLIFMRSTLAEYKEKCGVVGELAQRLVPSVVSINMIIDHQDCYARNYAIGEIYCKIMGGAEWTQVEKIFDENLIN